MMKTRIWDFINELSLERVGPDACNQYAPEPTEHGNSLRRANLERYLEEIATFRPRLLLVGEAPGYKGCRISGLPFTSERIMIDGVNSAAARASYSILGESVGYHRVSGNEKLSSEATATMIWDAISRLKNPPLLWNIFPFHPHVPGNPKSNRRPRANEIAQGMILLRQLIRLFDVPIIAGLGKIASEALMKENLSDITLRHPSHGGKNAFRIGLADLATEYHLM